MQSITVLGATGSIGDSTLDVIARNPDRFRVFALSGRERIDRLASLCLRFRPKYAAVPGAVEAASLQAMLRVSGCRVEVIDGPEALAQVAAHPEVDTVVAAIVGAAGLEATIAAARAGKRILLANKEALVMAGPVFVQACRESGATVLPIDSEHNAIFQCLPPGAGIGAGALDGSGVRRILLTASGGPFRSWTLEQMRAATPEQACAHPNWSMGRKISVDSATMMNKGLELIEAQLLFGVAQADIEIVVHPQSVIHSLVEYLDGSVLAQLGHPDMRTPIAHALGHPARIASGVSVLDLASIARLDFEAPDPLRFPCLRLAREALRDGPAAVCALNASNEIAVDAFLRGRIGFCEIAQLSDAVLQDFGSHPAPRDVNDVLALDAKARTLAADRILRTVA
ncbi:MAG: 1-deoxy-D-xylulose-5-phosphate reductoisomerase [Burkholderiaceae bacterium]|nr:1-deoxy-D-xylulose-5-phosphate reductoisomerase [Burkholderiaceae bacterium]